MHLLWNFNKRFCIVQWWKQIICGKTKLFSISIIHWGCLYMFGVWYHLKPNHLTISSDKICHLTSTCALCLPLFSPEFQGLCCIFHTMMQLMSRWSFLTVNCIFTKHTKVLDLFQIPEKPEKLVNVFSFRFFQSGLDQRNLCVTDLLGTQYQQSLWLDLTLIWFSFCCTDKPPLSKIMNYWTIHRIISQNSLGWVGSSISSCYPSTMVRRNFLKYSLHGDK